MAVSCHSTTKDDTDAQVAKILATIKDKATEKSARTAMELKSKELVTESSRSQEVFSGEYCRQIQIQQV